MAQPFSFSMQSQRNNGRKTKIYTAAISNSPTTISNSPATFPNSPTSIYAKKIRRFEKESTYGISFIKKYTLRGSNPGPTD